MRKIAVEELFDIATPANGSIEKIYLHWTAGPYGIPFRDYHINIDDDGVIYLMTEDLTEVKAHTWHRNTGAIGISMCCCEGALANSGYDAEFGEYPPTKKQIETLAKVIAALCKALDLPVTAESVMTHQEAATEDDYGPFSGDPETRWDLWYLPDYDGAMKPGGEVIRGKILWYLANGDV